MEMAGRYRLAARREDVWRGLNDPEILAKSIPGCQELSKEGDDGFAATVKARLGPVSVTFKGAVTLENLNPPASYTLRGEGKGGVAGFGKGSADVTLEEVDGGAATILSYASEAQIGGKLAQIGSRLIRGSVKKLTGEFFTNFAAAIGAEAEELPIEDEGESS
ncbi:MAG: carbon monoxide dehydrogenase subunit G [Neomegalonema sp.]|nr:carbon monoxide dehydrogenase subunit G [Neomegalonema sp.]